MFEDHWCIIYSKIKSTFTSQCKRLIFFFFRQSFVVCGDRAILMQIQSFLFDFLFQIFFTLCFYYTTVWLSILLHFNWRNDEVNGICFNIRINLWKWMRFSYWKQRELIREFITKLWRMYLLPSVLWLKVLTLKLRTLHMSKNPFCFSSRFRRSWL